MAEKKRLYACAFFFEGEEHPRELHWGRYESHKNDCPPGWWCVELSGEYDPEMRGSARTDAQCDAIALEAALKALNTAFLGVPFKATPSQLAAMKAASEQARAALAAAPSSMADGEGRTG